MIFPAAVDLAHMLPGFSDPVHDSQRSFRCVLDALCRPGRIVSMPIPLAPPPELSISQCAILLSLADQDTPVWLPAALRTGQAAHYLRFHCGCPLTDDLAEAHFAVLDGLAQLPAHSALRLGKPAFPDRSTTLIVEVNELAASGPIRLTGPGIPDARSISVGGWTRHTTGFLQQNRAAFPQGVDLLLTNGAELMGLPRSTIVEA